MHLQFLVVYLRQRTLRKLSIRSFVFGICVRRTFQHQFDPPAVSASFKRYNYCFCEAMYSYCTVASVIELLCLFRGAKM